MDLGRDQLRDWLKRRQVNQREGAELLGITDVFLSQLLAGLRSPGLTNAHKIERLTGIPTESWMLSDLSNQAEPVSAGGSKRKFSKR